jgi:ankyrin repeat protein
VIAWDYGLSPLHLAILNGHLEIIKLLATEYGADVLLPVKLVEPGTSNARGAIMTILLALSLPAEKAKEVVELLLSLGATSAQADMNRLTTLHYLVGQDRADILDVLLANDRPVALSVLHNLGFPSKWGNEISSPLITAIERGYQKMVTKLLDLGATPTISFDDWIKAYIAKNEWAKNQTSEKNMEQYLSSCTQPIITAAGKGLGTVVQDLLAHGADPETLEKGAYNVLKNHQNRNYQVCESLLDVVQNKLKLMRVSLCRPLKAASRKSKTDIT